MSCIFENMLNIIPRSAIALCGIMLILPARHAESANRLPPLLQTHCAGCHNDTLTEGELDLTPLLENRLILENRGRLVEKMLKRVQTGEMPPDDAVPLSRAERGHLAEALQTEYTSIRNHLKDDPGTVVIPRLTPAEYRNVIRDLSGGVVTEAGRYLPNEGGAGEGFSNVGAAQSMTPAQLEKYLEAAKDVLRHVRFFPTEDGDVVWRSYPREPVNDPQQARKELTDDVIAWHIAQQQKWNEEHRSDLNDRLGFIHAAYLEAAWKYHWRHELGKPKAPFSEFAVCDGVALAPVSLEKWYGILSAPNPEPPFVEWASAWQQLPPPGQAGEKQIRKLCVAIEQGTSGLVADSDEEDFAPEYEISFHEAKEEVLAAAEKEGRWPFRIEIGDAEELFLVVTDAGDGNRGEYAVWRRGRFVFKDGTSRPWEKTVTLIGANSGREYPFGIDGEGSSNLPAHSIGVRPPGALKFAVPENAIVFEVETALDTNRTKQASIQSLVLKKKPKSQSYVPGRYVFGGKKRQADGDKENKELARALRKRNVSEANLTKIGLNAERNVFADWKQTPLEEIGGPWPDQKADTEEPLYPYHFTVKQVRENAGRDDLAVLAELQERLLSVVRSDIQEKLDTREQRQAAITRRMLEHFATRAWRRPVADTELERLLSLYRNSRSQGFSYDGSVKSSLLAVLASPHFLYRGSIGDAPDSQSRNVRSLDSYELASRLSFFLWASVPDEELLHLAAKHKLQDPDILRRQANRMLQDPKARSLATDFAGQLWSFTDFKSFDGPDAGRFPEFTPSLRHAMELEVIEFLSEVFQNDRPLTDLLSADYTFVNSELARHYGLDEAIIGKHMRRIELPEGHPRGGIASMGLFLTKTSLPLRTSPVQRGTWVLEQLLGRELPNPPANIPPLSEDDTNAEGETILQQLERHRSIESCAACHDKIDPLGIALENFDPVGRWRDRDRKGSELSTTAVTHDGVELHGIDGLKQYFTDHQNEFFRHLHRKLLGYALGRSIHPGDDFLLEQMEKRQRESGHRFSSLVETIVTSPQFRTRRTQGTHND